MEQKVKIELTTADIDVILNLLGNEPYIKVANLINSLIQQAREQMTPVETKQQFYDDKPTDSSTAA